MKVVGFLGVRVLQLGLSKNRIDRRIKCLSRTQGLLSAENTERAQAAHQPMIRSVKSLDFITGSTTGYYKDFEHFNKY